MGEILQSEAPTFRPWPQTASRGQLAEKRRNPARSAGAERSLIYAETVQRSGSSSLESLAVVLGGKICKETGFEGSALIYASMLLP